MGSSQNRTLSMVSITPEVGLSSLQMKSKRVFTLASKRDISVNSLPCLRAIILALEPQCRLLFHLILICHLLSKMNSGDSSAWRFLLYNQAIQCYRITLPNPTQKLIYQNEKILPNDMYDLNQQLQMLRCDLKNQRR